MKDYHLDNLSSKNKKNQDVKKSLNNYIDQVKIHFDLSENEAIKILEIVLSGRKGNNCSYKKWWHLWKE